MSEFTVCTVSKAKELMSHLSDDDLVVLCVLNKKSHIHDQNRKIKKKKGEELIRSATHIMYQNNDYFGVLSLEGVRKEVEIMHNILFPFRQLE